MLKDSFRFRIAFLVLILISSQISSCKKDNDSDPENPSGKIIFSIEHKVGGQLLKENELIYINAAGNEYLITEVKYFISDITFYHSNGSRKVIGEWKDIYYVDENITETKTIRFYDDIPTGSYDSITFVFGIPEEKNKSFMFVNPPEVNMFWPEVLGGGYHYMMINGKWKDTVDIIQPFNFHLGIGQLYHGSTYDVDSIYAFVQNYFTVHLPGSAFTMNDQDTIEFRLSMDIEKWFENPHIFDFNYWGGAIMQNQQAMQTAKENGWDVFSISRLP